MLVREAQQVYDGVMLSDGGLILPRSYPRAWFQIALSGKEHLDWLYYIKDALEGLDITVTPGHPKVRERVRPSGDTYDYCYLGTKTSEFLTLAHRRWYPGRHTDGTWRKEVPEDFLLTPISLANWFMGDSTSGRDKRRSSTITLTLLTHCFSEHGISVLEEQLHSFNLSTGRAHRRVLKGSGIEITIPQNSIDAFADLVEYWVLPSYRHKVLRRKEVE